LQKHFRSSIGDDGGALAKFSAGYFYARRAACSIPSNRFIHVNELFKVESLENEGIIPGVKLSAVRFFLNSTWTFQNIPQ
jgi:hypothetical protein